MADPAPGDDNPVVLAGRRQLLLAGCGIALTSVLAPGAGPARPGDQARPARHMGQPRRARPGNQAQQAWPGNRMRDHADPAANPRLSPLFISVSTVRSHLDRIRDKTGYRRHADLTRLALQAGLV
jgi:hypothetical protein